MPRIYVAPPIGPYKDFALRFREACQDAKLPATLKGLATTFAVSTTTINDWRHGWKLPSAATMEFIAKKTVVSYEWLATGRGVKYPPTDSAAAALAGRIERASPEVRRYIEAILTASENPGPANGSKSDPTLSRHVA